MRAALIISFLLIYYSGSSVADLSIRYDTIGKHQQKPLDTLLIKQGLVRINPPVESAQSVMIDLDNGDIIQLHPQSKRYFKINAETLGGYAKFYTQNRSMLQGLIDQGMRQLSPDKRDQVEQIIGSYKRGSKQIRQMNIRALDKTDRVLGVGCSVYGIFKNGQLQREVCISSYQQLGLNEDDVQSLEQLKKFIQQFRQSVPREQQQIVNLLSNTLAELNGLPMQIVSLYPNGEVRVVVKAASISFRSIPPQAYRIPNDYQQQALPVL